MKNEKSIQNHTNFTAYKEVEAFENYSDVNSLIEYRKARILFCENYSKYISILLAGRENAKAVEIGSGSSALLFSLLEKKIITEGIGIEQSESRFNFAERWKKDCNYFNVKNICSNFVDIELPHETFDLYLIVDNTFSYLYPENQLYPKNLIQQAEKYLKKDGYIIIELNNYVPFRKTLREEKTTKLPESNPFEYAVHIKTFDIETNILKSEAKYIRKDGKEKSKIELSYVYDVDTVASLLSEHNFDIVNLSSDFVETRYNENDSSKFVITAKKN